MGWTTWQEITGCVQEHEAWRSQCMNLIASENALSPAVRGFFGSDLVQRYGNYLGRDLENRRYSGNRYVQEIEVRLAEIVRTIFGASEVELRAISGHVAGLAVLMATCEPGDTVLELSSADGGHCLARKAAQSPLIDLNVLPIPFDPVRYNIDVEATCRLIAEKRPRVVMLGSSNFLFPHPVGELAECAAGIPGTVLAYDASHVFGLIACGEFQDPLREGAHVIFGSTHKTLPGPQGGLIVSNDSELMDAISTAVYPGVVTNHHLTRSPALAVALLEMSANKGYARQVVRNAQALGVGLSRHGLPIVAAASGFTVSHTVLMQVAEFGTGQDAARALEAADVMVSYTRLPAELGGQGIRLGTSEVTRLGADEDAIFAAADIIADIVQGKTISGSARDSVHRWTEQLAGIRYAEFA